MFGENAGRAECVPHKNKYLQVRTEVSVSKVALKLKKGSIYKVRAHKLNETPSGHTAHDVHLRIQEK